MADAVPEELALLREIARWTREAALPVVRQRVERLVDTDGKKRVYQGLATGTHTVKALEASTGVNHNDIRKWLDAWEAERIAEPGAKPPRAIFSLAELGLAAPPARSARTAKGERR
jgi:transposase-like protein